MMPLKVNLGLNKKIGLPDYGSAGASCHVELELDSSLMESDLEGFHQRVRQAYVACSQAINDELARQQDRGDQPMEQPNANGNGHANGSPPPASQKQQNYIQHLASQIDGLHPRNLALIANKLHGKPIGELTSFEASGLIDTLKSIQDGTVVLDEILAGTES